MAFNQIPVDIETEWGRKLRRFRDLAAQFINLGHEVRGKMIACIDGSDFTQLEAQFGLPSGKGDEAFGELDSMFSKLITDAPVTNVGAAIEQFINFIG